MLIKWRICTYELRHFAIKLWNTCTSVTVAFGTEKLKMKTVNAQRTTHGALDGQRPIAIDQFSDSDDLKIQCNTANNAFSRRLQRL